MTCIWPILGACVDTPSIQPFVIGVFLGKGHLKSSNEFMKEFCTEVSALYEKGIIVSKDKNLKTFEIRAFGCDSPAKAHSF